MSGTHMPRNPKFEGIIYQQPEDSREALVQAAKIALQEMTGVSDRTIERWEAYLTGSSSQKRNPAGAFSQLDSFHISMDVAEYYPNDDQQYVKEGPEIWADIEDPASFFTAILSGDVDAAFQQIFVENEYPSGTIYGIDEVRFS